MALGVLPVTPACKQVSSQTEHLNSYLSNIKAFLTLMPLSNIIAILYTIYFKDYTTVIQKQGSYISVKMQLV